MDSVDASNHIKLIKSKPYKASYKPSILLHSFLEKLSKWISPSTFSSWNGSRNSPTKK
jgi:hypothetical protein